MKLNFLEYATIIIIVVLIVSFIWFSIIDDGSPISYILGFIVAIGLASILIKLIEGKK